MNDAKSNFIFAASELMHTEAGRHFYEALAVQVEESREQLVMAPPEHLSYAQGVARQGTVLLRQMRNADADKAKIIAGQEAAQRSRP